MFCAYSYMQKSFILPCVLWHKYRVAQKLLLEYFCGHFSHISEAIKAVMRFFSTNLPIISEVLLALFSNLLIKQQNYFPAQRCIFPEQKISVAHLGQNVLMDNLFIYSVKYESDHLFCFVEIVSFHHLGNNR